MPDLGMFFLARRYLFTVVLSFVGTLEDWDAAFSKCRVQLLRVNERRQKVSYVLIMSYNVPLHFFFNLYKQPFCVPF